MTRSAMVAVFPDPAPAITSSGSSGDQSRIARRWAGAGRPGPRVPPGSRRKKPAPLVNGGFLRVCHWVAHGSVTCFPSLRADRMLGSRQLLPLFAAAGDIAAQEVGLAHQLGGLEHHGGGPVLVGDRRLGLLPHQALGVGAQLHQRGAGRPGGPVPRRSSPASAPLMTAAWSPSCGWRSTSLPAGAVVCRCPVDDPGVSGLVGLLHPVHHPAQQRVALLAVDRHVERDSPPISLRFSVRIMTGVLGEFLSIASARSPSPLQFSGRFESGQRSSSTSRVCPPLASGCSSAMECTRVPRFRAKSVAASPGRLHKPVQASHNQSTLEGERPHRLAHGRDRSVAGHLLQPPPAVGVHATDPKAP